MKILFFIMSMGRGGAERVIANLANRYAANDDNVTVVTCQQLTCEYELRNEVKFFTLDKTDVQHNKIIRFIKRRSSLKKLLCETSFDMVICFLPEPSFIMLSLKKQFNLKVIVSERWDPVQEYTKLPNKIMMNVLYPKADGFVFQTEDAQNYFKSKIKNNSVIIPNPLNDDFLNEVFDTHRKKEIVSVGRLYPQKNHKMLIEAFALVYKQFPDYILKIYGKGILETELMMLIESLHLEQNVYLMGEEKNIKQAIKGSGIFVLSSDSEGMPNALMEAMALGIPVIATDCPCGGPKYLIENGVNGLLTGVGNVQQLADKMVLLLENPEMAEKLALNAMEIVKKINPDQVYSEWNEYIQKIQGNVSAINN